MKLENKKILLNDYNLKNVLVSAIFTFFCGILLCYIIYVLTNNHSHKDIILATIGIIMVLIVILYIYKSIENWFLIKIENGNFYIINMFNPKKNIKIETNEISKINITVRKVYETDAGDQYYYNMKVYNKNIDIIYEENISNIPKKVDQIQMNIDYLEED